MKSSDIQELAALSYLSVSDAKTEGFQQDFSGILEHIQSLQSVSEDADTLPRYYTEYLRSDQAMEHNPAFSEDVQEKILAQAPASEKGYLVVKTILKK